MQRFAAARLNPLHCGAVVASAWEPDELHPLVRVLIPFIAGQWSLPGRRRKAQKGAVRS